MWKECTHCMARQPLVNFSIHHRRTSGRIFADDAAQGIEGGRFNRHTATPSDVANEAELLVHSFSEEVQS